MTNDRTMNDERMKMGQTTKDASSRDFVVGISSFLRKPSFRVRPFPPHALLCAFALPFLPACGNRITSSNIDAVNAEFERSEKPARSDGDRGVSPKEVESILGVPSRVENFKMEVQTRRPIVEGVRYIYEQNGESIVLHFVDNKLISKAPHFGEAQPRGAEQKLQLQP
jgi:hypothetical protein